MTLDRRSFLQTSLTGLAVLAAGCQELPSREQGKAALSTEKLTDRVTLITGAPGNLVALSSGDGVVLVDSGSLALAHAVRASLSGAHVRTLFNTHYHAEQTGG